LKSAQKRKIYLGIDTTTDAFSVALGLNGEIDEERIPGRKHAEKLIPVVDSMIKKAGIVPRDITAVAGGIGPGSFTGIRVGLSFAMTFSQVLDIPVFGISMMDMAGRDTRCPAVRAYRDRYYYAEYSAGGCRLGDFGITGREEMEEMGCCEIKIRAASFFPEVDRLIEKGSSGSWKEIEPVYVMETVYRSKKDDLGDSE